MNTRFILYTTAGAILWHSPAQAGSSAGGTGASAMLIPADSLSTGGGQSAGGSGANAVLVTSSMGGIVSTITAASPAITNQQGYIPQITGPPTLGGYDLWASNNIPAGRDTTFTGDWNGDGILNGVAYVFGNIPVSMTGQGRIPVPPSIPADVNVFLDKSPDLGTWNLDRVSWVNGAAPTFVNGNFSIVSGVVVDIQVPPGGKAFYRYRVVKR